MLLLVVLFTINLRPQFNMYSNHGFYYKNFEQKIIVHKHRGGKQSKSATQQPKITSTKTGLFSVVNIIKT